MTMKVQFIDRYILMTISNIVFKMKTESVMHEND